MPWWFMYQEFLVYMCLSLRGKTKLPALPSPPLWCNLFQKVQGTWYNRQWRYSTLPACANWSSGSLQHMTSWRYDGGNISILFASTKVWKWMSKRFQTYGLLSVTKACTNRIRSYQEWCDWGDSLGLQLCFAFVRIKGTHPDDNHATFEGDLAQSSRVQGLGHFNDWCDVF